MPAISNYLEQKILDISLGNTSYTPPSTTYLALFTSSANLEANSTADELSGNGYSRQAISWGTASDGVISNDTAIAFSTATADWSAIYGMAIMDASTGGNVLYWSATAKKEVFNGATLNVAIGDLIITID